jgi:hypothetical protein
VISPIDEIAPEIVYQRFRPYIMQKCLDLWIPITNITEEQYKQNFTLQRPKETAYSYWRLLAECYWKWLQFWNDNPPKEIQPRQIEILRPYIQKEWKKYKEENTTKDWTYVGGTGDRNDIQWWVINPEYEKKFIKKEEPKQEVQWFTPEQIAQIAQIVKIALDTQNKWPD